MPARIDAKQMCLDLIYADDESEVLRILERHGLDDPAGWVPLGGIENNLSIVGNQQSSATAALVEKLVNGLDSLFLLECLRRGIDPESPDAPQTMTAAASAFFGIPDGNIARLKPPDRGRLSEHVQLIATGTKRDPSFTILDLGEGQRPCDFPTTFCSLVRSNKLRVPFVQGKFNMGGSGALPFCGQHHLQLVVSRRHPELVPGETGVEKTGWGWTLMRRRDPVAGRRSSSYEYLTISGQVPCFEAAELPLRPSREQAYEGPLRWGTLVKLYNYQIEYRSTVVFDLNFELSRRLYRLALPIRLSERRDYRGHSNDTILTGMSVRVEDDRAGVLEPGFPDSGVVHVDGVGEMPIEVVVFKKGEGRSFLTPQSAIMFAVNGQVHGTHSRRFLSRETVRLDFLKNDLMVVLNCTNAPPRVREDLFMPSRDRLRECDAKRTFEAALETYLHDHEELQRLNRERREEELRGRLADDQPLTEALRSVIDSSPELRQLFGQGGELPTNDRPGPENPNGQSTENPTTTEPFQGVPFPTFFHPVKPPTEGRPIEVKCPIGGVGRARFVTDAVNDYFTRASEPGSVTVTPADLFERVQLHDGRATVVLRCPDQVRVGATIEVTVSVTDPRRTQPFSHRLRLVVAEPATPTDRPDNPPPPPRAGALALPKIIEVGEGEWEGEDFTADSGLSMQPDIDGGLVAKVNVDNVHLQRTLMRTPEAELDLTRKRFVYGLVLSGLSLWREYSERDDCDELVRSASSAIARVLLPTITVLGALEQGLETR
jgi:hypothetical protein